MSPESYEHQKIKEIIKNKLEEWYGLGIEEYPQSGHEYDAYSITTSGISIFVEIIWSHSWTHFLYDINILQQSDEDVKVVIGSREVINDRKIIKEFARVVASERRKGIIIYPLMLDGVRIINDNDYVNVELRRIFEGLIIERQEIGKEAYTKNYFLERLEEILKEDIETTYYYGKQNHPRINLIIGPTFNLGEIFEPNERYAWLISTSPYIGLKGVTFRRKWFDCNTYDDIYFKVYMDGLFHIIIPLFLDIDKNLYYIDTTLSQIISPLIHYIRILKVKNINNDFPIKIILRNAANLIFGYDRRNYGRSTHQVSNKINDLVFDYNFNPNSNWSLIKELLYNIYKDFCTELGSSIQDIWIRRRIFRIIRDDMSIRTTYNNNLYPDLRILNINLNEFNFSEEDMNIR